MVHLPPKDFVHSPEEMARVWPRSEALDYTRWLATSHYENFHVVSLLLPKHLHRDFYSVYSYCRWADDLGDEIGNKQESLRLLAWWRSQLHDMYSGRATHPVFVALQQTVEVHELPMEPFEDLIRAFEQDQVVSRYDTWDELISYCRYSANPVGRLVLYLCGYRDPERQRLSDATCTGLQLANHWQDVSVDLAKDRVYIPLEVLQRHKYSVDDLFRGRETPEFRSAVKELVATTREFFRTGLPLAGTVNRRLALDIDLFSRGGMRVLERIEQQDYRVLSARPAIGKAERLGLFFRSLLRLAAPRAA
jgi:squalene synthase HpnC